MRIYSVTTVLAGALLLGSGCTTTDTQVSNSVYATHRIVRDLKDNIGTSVERLNETSADLIARVEASDQQMDRLQSMAEENQRKISLVDRKLTLLSEALYRYLNLTPPDTSGYSAPSGAGVFAPKTEIVRPDQSSVEGTPTTPAPGGEPGVISEDTMEQIGLEAETTDSVQAEADYRAAQQAFVIEKWEEALALFSAYLQKYPDGYQVGNASFWRAESLLRLKRHEEAIREFELFHETYYAPDNTKIPRGLLDRAECHLALGQKQKAIELLTELVNKFPLTASAKAGESRLRRLRGT